MLGGLHWDSAPVNRAWFGEEDIGRGMAIPEGKAPGLAGGGGDRDFIPGLEVQSQ